jgi:hypothetical protein
MHAFLLLAILSFLTAAIPANAQGKKSDVVVETDARGGSVSVAPKKCYQKGNAFTWIICPKVFQERGEAERFYLLILFTQRSEVAFPAFTRAEITITVDGSIHKTGDLDWTSDKIGRYALIPTSKDYLAQLRTAHDLSFTLQLSEKSTRSDIHLDDKGKQTLEDACGAIIDYSQKLVGLVSSATADVLPPDDVLHAKVLQVGREMGLIETYQDPDEGLFVWRVKLTLGKPGKISVECNALFAWYLKRVENKVALNDPLLLQCDEKLGAKLYPEIQRLQEEFKRRWRAAVGDDVMLIGSSNEIHSPSLLAIVLGLLSRESTPRVARALPAAPDAFTWRQLREINAVVLMPAGWHFKRVDDTKGIAAVAYFVTVEDIDAVGKFYTGLSLNVLTARNRSEDAEPVAKAKITADCAERSLHTPVKPLWEITEGVFHHYGCLSRVSGTAGPIIIDHRLVVNTRTKTMYILDFESPENQWEDAWTKGAKLVEMLLLDENI